MLRYVISLASGNSWTYRDKDAYAVKNAIETSLHNGFPAASTILSNGVGVTFMIKHIAVIEEVRDDYRGADEPELIF